VVVGRRVLCVNDDGTVQALARHSGEVLWAVGTGGAIRCRPLVADGVVYVGSTDGTLYALGLQDGTERWRFRAGAPVSGGCVLAQGTLVLGTAEGTLLGVEVQTGRARWTLPVGAPVCAPPAVMDDKVVVGTDGGRVLWVDPATGAVVGSVVVPGSGLVRAAPLFDAARVYLASSDGRLAAYDRKTLRLQWSSRIGRELSAGPIMDQDRLYCGNGGTRVLALTKSAGKVCRRWECGTRVQGSLAIVEGLLIASTAGGELVAFRVTEG
jgi:outer membrane protein assembly factor BamB